MKYTALTVSAVLVFAAACVDDEDLPFSPGGEPVADIDDGAHEGNQHFYFLPPMVDQPSYSGTFDGTLAPVVEICIWDGSQCRAALEIYNTETGPGSETVRVVPVDEHYIVNWHTDDILTDFPLQAGEHYRIRVQVGGQLLGFADVAVVNSGKELKNVDTDEYIPLLDGRTLPIKFRIEEGALEEGADEIVSAGRYHSCTVDASGAAYCWGWNWYGQLGTGSTYPYQPTPVAVTGGHTFQSVSAGDAHSCGVTIGGAAYCWGFNQFGQLGDNTTTASATPVAVTGGHTFDRVSLGKYHTCGVTADGDAYCWGLNLFGQLGVGDNSLYYSATPLAVTGGNEFQSVNARYYHTCGLSTDGSGFCWGYNYYGQVGDGTDGNHRVSPTAVTGGHTFQSLDAGMYHSCGATTANGAFCWGLNRYGQVGDGTFSNHRPNPTAVTGGLSFQHVSAGGYHSCGLAGGVAYCWGHHYYGQLGDGTFGTIKPSPTAVTGEHTFQSVSAGRYHSCGATTANDALCWGFNGFGQVGDGTYTSRCSPVWVLDLDPPTP